MVPMLSQALGAIAVQAGNVARSRGIRLRKLSVVLGALLVASTPAALAQVDEPLAPDVVREAQHRHARLGAILNNVVVAYERELDVASARDGEPRTLAARLAVQDAASRVAVRRAPMSRGTFVAVTLRIADPAKVDAVTRFLKDNGGDPRNVGEDYIEAYVPVALLVEASKQLGVVRVRAIIPPQPKRGAITSQGVAAHGATLWHALGFTGKGVKVGVIDGFGGFDTLVDDGELPVPVAARCYKEMGRPTSRLSDCEDKEDDHGIAVAEALLDIAPEVSLYIADPDTPGDLADAASWMASNGVQIINHSVSWPWDGPGDGTSPRSESPLNTVDAAIANDIVWVNAAGNEGQSAWFGRFRDTNDDGFHEFNDDDRGQFNCFPAKSENVLVQLRWQGPWHGSSLESGTDLDLYLHRVDERGQVNLRPVTVGQDEEGPTEGLVQEASVGEYFCVSVHQEDSLRTPPDWIQLIALTSEEFDIPTLGGSIGNPAESANPGILAVGAAPWNDNYTIEDYSSLGPTPDGRIKPDIVGVDMARSLTYPDGFQGTSQASPHVAGLAALVRHAYPNFNPQQVVAYLKSHAEPRTYHPTIVGLGHPNNVWGYGLARLPSITAIQRTRIPNDGAVHRVPLSRYFPTADDSTTFEATSSNPDLVTVRIHQGALLINSARGGVGEATITVTARLAEGSATVQIVVTVEAQEVEEPEEAAWPRPLSGWRLALYEDVSTTTSSTTAFRNAFVD